MNPFAQAPDAAVVQAHNADEGLPSNTIKHRPAQDHTASSLSTSAAPLQTVEAAAIHVGTSTAVQMHNSGLSTASGAAAAVRSSAGGHGAADKEQPTELHEQVRGCLSFHSALQWTCSGFTLLHA